jgi:hypothetical protein
MVRERDPRRLSAELWCYAALDRLGCYQPNRPAGAARRWWAADHRNDRRRLRAVEQRRWRRPSIIAQPMLQSARKVALADPCSLSSISANRFRSRRHSEASIEKQ